MVVGGLLAGAVGGAAVSVLINAVDGFSNVFASLNKKLLLAGGGITALGIAGAGAVVGLIKLGGQFEQTQIAFATMLGSAEEGNKLLKELADFASRTPFTITGIEQNAKQLLAMGIELDDLFPTLKSLGDVSSGLNVPLERLALNFGQVAVQGKLTGRELRDFSVAGVPLIAELSKNLGVSEAKIKEMVSAGEIGFPLVEQAFTTMTSEGGIFFDLMDKQSKTFLGQVSNIQDSFIKVGRVMSETFLPAAKFVAERLAVIVGWFEEHPTVSKFAAVALGVGTALALIIGPLLIMVALLPAIVAGFGALSAVTLPITGTILLVAAGIAALVAVGVLLFKNWDVVKEKGSLLVKFLSSIFRPQFEFLKLTLALLGLGFKVLWIQFIKPTFDRFKTFASWLNTILMPIITKIIDVISIVSDKISGVISKARGFVTSASADLSSSTKVNDFILQPGGRLIETNPNDTIIGTKTPGNLGGNVNVFIENLNATDAESVADALEETLKDKINF